MLQTLALVGFEAHGRVQAETINGVAQALARSVTTLWPARGPKAIR